MGRRPRSCTSRTASGARPPTHSSPSRHARSGLGLVDLGIEPDERVAILAPHPSRVDAGQPRHHLRRGRLGGDVPDELGVECRHVLEHPRRWRSSSRTPSSSRRSAGCASTCRLCARWWSWRPWDRWRTPWRGGAAPAGPHARSRRARGTDRRHHARRRLRAGLHVGHHRPGQGLPRRTRTTAAWSARSSATGSSTSPRRSSSTSPRPHLRPHHPVRRA